MAKRRPSLGRGLSALLGEVAPSAEDAAAVRDALSGRGDPSGAEELALPSSGQAAGGSATADSASARSTAAGPESAGPAAAGPKASRTARGRREAPSDAGAEQTAASGSLVELPVHKIKPNPRQPRRTIEPEALEELARSIRSTGVVQPIIVRPLAGGQFELIAGERRWRAAQLAGYTVVPAILRAVSDVESLEISLIENVVRQQLNPLDEAFALHVLLDDLGVTQEVLAERIGKSRVAVANKIRLLELPSEAQEFLINGTLTEGHGRALLGAKQRGDILRLARRAARQGLSVRAVEAEVKKLVSGGQSQRREDGTALPEPLVEETRERFWGLLEVMPRVRTRPGGEAGRIELPFKDQEDLRRILRKLADV